MSEKKNRGGQPRGTYLGGVRTPEDIRQRCFVCEESGCWLWRMGRDGDGCPKVTILRGEKHHCISTFRAALELAGVKPFRAEQVCFHRVACKNPADCVNPEHLRWGSKKQAAQYHSSLGKFRNPERLAILREHSMGRQKTTPAQRLEIERSTETATELAKRYGISRHRINVIRRERRLSRLAMNSSIFNLAA